MAIELRDYQVEAVERIRDELRAGRRRVLVVSPCGSGKTVLACEIIRHAVAKGRRVLFIAHRRELIDQTSAKLVEAGVDHGLILAGRGRAPQKAVQVGSIQTIARRDLPDAQLVIVDECHHVTQKNSYGQLLGRYPQATMLGATATPWRLDKIGLCDSFDSHVLVRMPHELLADNWLVPVVGHRYRPIDIRGVRVTGGDFASGELSRAARQDGLLGDVVGEWLAHCRTRLTAAFCVDLLHANDLCARFQGAGVQATVVSYKTAPAERAAALAAWRARRIQVLVNVELVTEGFDLPALDCVLLCRPTLSQTLFLQMAGRALRPSPGKQDARFHDHAGLFAFFRHPYDPLRDYSPTATAVKPTVAAYAEASERLPDGQIVLPLPLELPGEPEPIDQPPADVRTAKLQRARDFAERWKTRTIEDKRDFFSRMVARHSSPRKAAGIYHWMSGETEWPPIRWRLDAGEPLTGKLRLILQREQQDDVA